jgi:hypothetical protein
MIAYYVKKDEDEFIIIPETDQVISADSQSIKEFISPSACFKTWLGMHHENVKPEDFGKVIATRNDDGDIQVKDEDVWKKIMLTNI